MSFIMRPVRFASSGFIIEGSGVHTVTGTRSNLTKTFGTTRSSARIFTMSLIIKRVKFGAREGFLYQQANGNSENAGLFEFDASDRLALKIQQVDSGTIKLQRITTQVFRDPSAWMHIHIAINTGLTTDACCKIHINGTEITAFDTKTNIDSARDHGFLNSSKELILMGLTDTLTGSATEFQQFAYMSRVFIQDGVYGVPTDVGEVTGDGFWQINDASELTFGTNGFLIEGGTDVSTGTDSQFPVTTDATVTNTASEVKDGTNSTNLSFTGVAIGTADTNRKVVVVATGGIGGGTHSSMVIGGVSATLVAQESAGANNHSSMWEAAVPNGTTATIAYTTSVADIRNAIGVWAVYNASDVYYSSATSTADPLSAGGMTIPAGGVGIGGCYNGNTSAFTWVGLTEDYDELIFDAQYHSGASKAFSTRQNEITVTADITGTPSAMSGCFASWGPAGLNHFTKTGTIAATNDSPTNGDA